MAPTIGQHFFAHTTDSHATIDALMVFAVGFLCRPLGGIVFGYFGDTRGRSKTLRISILMITLSTFLVGILPSYNQWGVMASILFILLRLLQGISIGGEYSGVMIYLAESAPPKQRGFTTSFAAIGANVGFLLASLTLMLLHICLSKEAIDEWGWRLPFLIIGIPGFIMTYYRFQLSETTVYSKLLKKEDIERVPFIAAIQYAPKQLLTIFGLSAMGSTFYYVFFGYMPTYLEHYIGFSLGDALIIESLMLMIMLVTVPLSGLCGDYFSRKKMIIFTALAMILLVWPCFYLLQSKSLLLIALSLSLATILSSLEQGNTLAAIVENCPENVRYSGISFSYNLGNALFGGSAPLIVSLLTENIGLLAPAFYLMLMISISLISATMILSNNQSIKALSLKLK